MAKFSYTPATGEAFDLGSQDAFGRALADIGNRLGALEAAPKGDSAGADSGRLARLEAVVQPFFRDEFSDFDVAQGDAARNAAAADKSKSE